MALDDAAVRGLADRLVRVGGVRAVTLGGSRARGTHTAASDHDLGLYYRPPLDVAALGALARAVAGPDARVTAPGGWGPWVDGGGWLTVDGAPVDWIYRDLDRVAAACTAAAAGRYAFHTQAGHPLGFCDVAYAGELALGVVLADPAGDLAALRARLDPYPPALSAAFAAGLWEADFLIGTARKAVSRGDVAYLAGCLFRALGVCAHALHGAAGAWVVNEKGLVASAARLPGAPDGFAAAVAALFTGLDTDPGRAGAVLDAAADLIGAVRGACAIMIGEPVTAPDGEATDEERP